MEGDKVTLAWLLENHGGADLIIERTKSSCGCTVVKLSDKEKVIPPGGSLELKATFDSTRRRGPQSNSVIVESNDAAEPKLKLTFKAQVDYLYEVVPSTIFNLRALQRRQTAARTLDIVPGPGRSAVEILDVKLEEGAPLTCSYESFKAKSGTGQRFTFTVKEDAALGRMTTSAKIKLKVAGVEREREVPIRAEIVGDLIVQPKVVDATRQTSTRGKQLAPVSVRSTHKMRFDVLGASAGPLLNVEVEPFKNAPPRTQYEVLLNIRDDAPSGPFGTMLEVQTTSADQPVISVPVFGIVAPLIHVDPPIILLRQDGTPAGTQRRLRLRASIKDVLDISEIKCDSDAVAAAIDSEGSANYRHLVFLDVRLVGKPPPGNHEATLVLSTSIKGVERLEIPVRIDVPE
jgi:hypothetical protein